MAARDHCTDTARVMDRLKQTLHADADADAGTMFFTVRAEMTPTYYSSLSPDSIMCAVI
jgi:hypothetical protein